VSGHKVRPKEARKKPRVSSFLGADDVCRESRTAQGARGRIYTPEQLVERDPGLVVASWCVRKAAHCSRSRRASADRGKGRQVRNSANRIGWDGRT
jgi:hypothetical protein